MLRVEVKGLEPSPGSGEVLGDVVGVELTAELEFKASVLPPPDGGLDEGELLVEELEAGLLDSLLPDVPSGVFAGGVAVFPLVSLLETLDEPTLGEPELLELFPGPDEADEEGLEEEPGEALEDEFEPVLEEVS